MYANYAKHILRMIRTKIQNKPDDCTSRTAVHTCAAVILMHIAYRGTKICYYIYFGYEYTNTLYDTKTQDKPDDYTRNDFK